MQRFSAFHPLASFLYFVSALCVTMFSRNIVIAALSLAGAMLFYAVLGLRGGIWLYFIIFILTALSNPLFSHNGMTVLFFLNGNQITLEAVIYGVYLGMMIMAVLMWFSCYNDVITSDKFLCLFGSVMPKAALIISMALRLVPSFISEGKEMLEIHSALLPSGKSAIKRIKRYAAVFSCLITRSLEGAAERSDSMRARGYGKGKRVSYSRFRFKASDAIMIAVSLLWIVFMFFFGGTMEFNYYPEADPLKFNAAYIIAAVYFILPSLINLWGELKWRYLASRI